MNEFISMLESFWIVRDENGSDYVRIKHAADNEMKNFIYCPLLQTTQLFAMPPLAAASRRLVRAV